MNSNGENTDSLNTAASAVEEALSSVQNMALKSAAEHIKGQWQKNRMLSLKSYCLTIFVSVLMVCFTTIACFAIYQQQETIREQQYALNAQYAQLMEYVSGAEITTVTESYEANADNGSAAVLGDNNTTTIGG